MSRTVTRKLKPENMKEKSTSGHKLKLEIDPKCQLSP